MVKISIVIAVYNNEKYLPKAVESVEKQGYDEYEIIVVDDGSTDRTPYIADELASRNPKIKVIHQENQWIYASFNNGIACATGDYIYILNSDDKLMDGALKLMAQKVEEYNHPDIIWTVVVISECDENQNIIRYDLAKAIDKVQEEIFLSTKESVRNSWPYLIRSSLATNQANLYKSDIMKLVKFRNDVYGADTLFNISIAPYVESALIIKEPIYSFFAYNASDRNTSIGKYYGYEHSMFNDIFDGYIALFSEWELSKDAFELISRNRTKNISSELKSMSYTNCPLSLEQKLKKIFGETIDDSIKKCIFYLNNEEEIEARILSEVRNMLIREDLNESSEMYFVYELLDSLLRYEKDEEDYKKIENAINHPLNPMHIGKIFYSKLKKSEAYAVPDMGM